MYLACDPATLECHGWSDLQTGIETLIADQDISLPDNVPADAEKGYFYPLLPSIGQRPPYPDNRFVNSIYHQLEAARFLKKKLEVDGTYKYQIISDGPPINTTAQFPDDVVRVWTKGTWK